MKETKLLSLLLVAASLCSAQTTNFSITNKPLSDPELNNYHRGAQYWNGTSWDNSQAPQVPNGTSTTGAKTFYRRYWWTECEGAQGVYKFTKASQAPNEWWKSVEAGLEWCANNGALYSLGGVMTSYDGQDGVYYDGAWSVYPQYLHNLMQAEPVYKDWKYNGTNNWIPNWNSQAYLDSWKRLNDTLLRYIKNYKITPTSGPWAGKLIEGWKIIDFIDLRGYGNFGEWHTWPWTQNQPANAICTDSSMKKIIDIAVDVWGDYPLHVPIAIFDDNGWSESNAFRAWYAMTRTTRYGVVGWRRDNIGDAGYDNFLIGNTWTYGSWKADTAILNRWKYAMITGEPLNGSAPCCPYFYHVRSEIGNYHYAGFGNGNYGNNSAQTWDTIRTVFKLTGYRFNLNGGSMPAAIAPNRDFTLSLNWRNVGAAPLYSKRWRVVYDLKTQADSSVRTWISAFNPYLYLPSTKDSVVTEILGLPNIAPGTYKLTIKIEDTAKLLAPLFLAINNPPRNSDGSYTLRSDVLVTSALPVKWEGFTAVAKESHNELSWKVSCSKDSDRYFVERSEDGQMFYPIAEVLAIENDCVSRTYTYADNRYMRSLYTYYRIKQLDLDGKFVYSSIQSVRGGQFTGLTVRPNPTTGELNILIKNSILGQGTIHIYNALGQEVKTYPFSKRGPYYDAYFNISSLPSGRYNVSVRIGREIIATKALIKN